MIIFSLNELYINSINTALIRILFESIKRDLIKIRSRRYLDIFFAAILLKVSPTGESESYGRYALLIVD